MPCRDGRLIGAVAVARGIGVLRGLAAAPVPGATGTSRTSYEAKRDAAISAFADGADLVVVHVAATDEAGHDGDVDAKVAALGQAPAGGPRRVSRGNRTVAPSVGT